MGLDLRKGVKKIIFFVWHETVAWQEEKFGYAQPALLSKATTYLSLHQGSHNCKKNTWKFKPNVQTLVVRFRLFPSRAGYNFSKVVLYSTQLTESF